MLRASLFRAGAAFNSVPRRMLASGRATRISAWSARQSTKIDSLCLTVVALTFSGTLVVTSCQAERLERWQHRWDTDNLAWHRSEPNALLIQHLDKFLKRDDKRAETRHRVLVPLCGKTVDIPYLAEKGHEVVGVDGVEAAAWQLQRDAWLKFDVSLEGASSAHEEPDAGIETLPKFVASPSFSGRRDGYVFKTDNAGTGYYLDSKPTKWFRDLRRRISFVIYDFLQIGPRDIGKFDRIWDRAALVAVRPEDREAYVCTCDTLLEPGGRILLVTLDYDQEKMKGPPFSIPVAEVKRLYGKLGYKIETLSSFDARKDYQGTKWNALQTTGLDEVAYLLTKPPSTGPGWFAGIFSRRKAP